MTPTNTRIPTRTRTPTPTGPTLTPTITLTPTPTHVPGECYREGEIKLYGEPCCIPPIPTPTLVDTWTAYVRYPETGYTCGGPVPASRTCIACGDSACGLGENWCNCIGDCPVDYFVALNGSDTLPPPFPPGWINYCINSIYPCRTIDHVLHNLQARPRHLIKVASNGDGTYPGFTVNRWNATISGGWDNSDPNNWVKTNTKSIIDGGGVNKCITVDGTGVTTVIEDLEIQSCTGTGNGVAVAVSQPRTNGTTIIRHNIIRNNTATGSGGSIISCSSCSSIESNAIYSNTSSGSIIYGQGYMNSVKNNMIYNNTITVANYGPISISIYKSSTETACPPVCTTSMISNNTIDNNTGGEAVVYVYGGSSANTSYNVYAKNNIISNHSICDFKSVSTYSILHYANNLRYLNPMTACDNTFSDGGNNSTTTNPYIGSGNYHLNSLPAPTNAAKDAGANLLNETPPDIRKVLDDIDGQSRPYNSIYDIGADEYYPAGLGAMKTVMGAPASPTPTRKPTSTPTPRLTATPATRPTITLTPNPASTIPGLVGLWRLDEGTGTTAKDSSGNGLNGTLGSSPSAPIWTSGRFGKALSFDGSNDYVNIADNNVFSVTTTQQLTIAGWFKKNKLGVWGYPISKRRGASSYEWDIRTYTDNRIGCVLLTTAGANYLSTGSSSPVYTATGQWHHIACTINNSPPKMILYIDGVAVDTKTTTSGSLVNGTAPVRIGIDANGDGPINITADDVRIYNRALTSSEVNKLYTASQSVLGKSTKENVWQIISSFFKSLWRE